MNSFISKAVTVVIGIFLCGLLIKPASVSAASTLTTPVISEKAVFSGKFELTLENSGKYKKGTKFEVWVDGKYARSASIESLAEDDNIFEIAGGSYYFAPKTKHSVKVRAVSGSKTSAFSKTFTAVTADKTMYRASQGRAYYKLSGQKLVKAGTLPEDIYVYAVLADAKGANCEGKNVKTNTAKYIKITSGDYKNKYISVSEVKRKTSEQAKSAAPAKPELSVEFKSADKIGVGITNLSSYKAGTVFNVYVNGSKLKTVKLDTVKRDGYISVYSDPDKNLKKETSYKIAVEAKRRQLTSRTSKTVKTASVTYFKLNSGVKLYKFTDGKFKSAGTVAYTGYGEGVQVDKNAKAAAGKSKDTAVKYIKIKSGDYKGLYVRPDDTHRMSAAQVENMKRQAKINKVVAYAKSNAGGSYVSCGERYRATDCSGLTMLAYRQIGVNLPHSAYGQMLRGKRVSAANMQPGDIIVANGYNHAMMYIGNGQLVHAMNWRDGIRIQSASTAMYYNPVNCIVRII